MQEYDLVLILGHFRRLTYYLNIIQYLGQDFRIGLLPIPLDVRYRLESKHPHTQQDFLETCVSMGAHLIEEGPVSAEVTLFPQEPYTEEACAHIHTSLSTASKVAVMAFAWAGMHDAFLEEFDIRKIFVIHKRFSEFLLQHRGNAPIYEGREVIEVGLPYKKYPLFPEFQTDYLLAIPTPYSFPNEKDKWLFLETVLSLLAEIDPGDTVVHKPHNAAEHDYFSDKRYRYIVRLLRVLPDNVVDSLLERLACMTAGKVKNYIGRLYTAFLYEKVMARVIPLERLTPHHDLAMESFLPGVRKGVMGGLSNTIWGTLFFQLPFYNCVDIERQSRDDEDRLYGQSDPTTLLDLNLQFFHVPYCNGRLEFDPKYFDIVDDSTRQGDLIEALRQECYLTRAGSK